MDHDGIKNVESELLPAAPSEEAPIGTIIREGQYVWHRVLVRYGRGRWAYWTVEPQLNRLPQYTVCADTIYNDAAPHYAGLLAKPHSGGESIEWLLIEPKLKPAIPRPLYIEDIERSEGRYETNDVDRINTPVKPTT